MIALELAAEFPHMLRSLSLIATHAGGPLGIAPVIGMARFVRSVACLGRAACHSHQAQPHSHPCARTSPLAAPWPRRRMRRRSAS